MKLRVWVGVFAILVAIGFIFYLGRQGGEVRPRSLDLPSSKVLMFPVPGHPQPTNSFPTATALSPDGRYLAVLNNGYGTEQSGYQQ